jgi:C1A family cysteine protease
MRVFTNLAGVTLAATLAATASARSAASTDADAALRLLAEEARDAGWTFDVSRGSLDAMPLDADTGFRRAPDWQKQAPFVSLLGASGEPLPAKFDWREKGVVGPIRDQAQPVYCGSCWAHGTTAAFESAVAIKTGHLPDVSPQQLVSCRPSYGTCGGGDFAFGFYLQKGANYESDFPYTARNSACRNDAAQHEKATDWGYVGASNREPTTEELKRAILTYGPIAVTVSSSPSWRAYSGGVYNACDSRNINHIVALVGWDDADQAWIVKNSHGTVWGEQGYMRSKYVDGRGRKCNGIGESAAFVVYTPAA